VKCLAVKAGKIKLTPRIFQAPEKTECSEVHVNPHAFTNCFKNTTASETIEFLKYTT